MNELSKNFIESLKKGIEKENVNQKAFNSTLKIAKKIKEKKLRELSLKEFYICNFIGIIIPLIVGFLINQIFLGILSTYFFPVVVLYVYKFCLIVFKKKGFIIDLKWKF
jgi:uncharacterized protein with PQ loop repeat